MSDTMPRPNKNALTASAADGDVIEALKLADLYFAQDGYDKRSLPRKPIRAALSRLPEFPFALADGQSCGCPVGQCAKLAGGRVGRRSAKTFRAKIEASAKATPSPAAETAAGLVEVLLAANRVRKSLRRENGRYKPFTPIADYYTALDDLFAALSRAGKRP